MTRNVILFFVSFLVWTVVFVVARFVLFDFANDACRDGCLAMDGDIQRNENVTREMEFVVFGCLKWCRERWAS